MTCRLWFKIKKGSRVQVAGAYVPAENAKATGLCACFSALSCSCERIAGNFSIAGGWKTGEALAQRWSLMLFLFSAYATIVGLRACKLSVDRLIDWQLLFSSNWWFKSGFIFS